jgi:Rhodopirellula transposase DDE domain
MTRWHLSAINRALPCLLGAFAMDDLLARHDALLVAAAKRLKGQQRRLFLAEVTLQLCDGNPRQAERRFGWGRDTVAKGLHELQQGIRCLENFAARARPRWEEMNPQLAQDIRALVEPHTHADPELKSERRYTNLSAAEVRQALKAQKGYADQDLPKERTMRDILNRMHYRLKRIQKAKPLKKPKQTDAIFANVAAVQQAVKNDPAALEVSIDTKAKVNEGDYGRGGKNPDRRGGPDAEGVGS